MCLLTTLNLFNLCHIKCSYSTITCSLEYFGLKMNFIWIAHYDKYIAASLNISMHVFYDNLNRVTGAYVCKNMSIQKPKLKLNLIIFYKMNVKYMG